MTATLAQLPDFRISHMGTSASALTAIYQSECHMAVWKKGVPEDLSTRLTNALNHYNFPAFATIVSPEDVKSVLLERYEGMPDVEAFSAHVALVVDMFCCLFELKRTGLRLKALSRAMCPKFHVDHVPCRLVTTYSGVATQWLADQDVDRNKLGIASKGLSDEQAGIYSNELDIQQLETGDVALLKGEKWWQNEGGGLVHRSPELSANEQRIVLTLDFAD